MKLGHNIKRASCRHSKMMSKPSMCVQFTGCDALLSISVCMCVNISLYPSYTFSVDFKRPGIAYDFSLRQPTNIGAFCDGIGASAAATFTARRYAIASSVYTVAPCPSVCPSQVRVLSNLHLSLSSNPTIGPLHRLYTHPLLLQHLLISPLSHLLLNLKS